MTFANAGKLAEGKRNLKPMKITSLIYKHRLFQILSTMKSNGFLKTKYEHQNSPSIINNNFY